MTNERLVMRLLSLSLRRALALCACALLGAMVSVGAGAQEKPKEQSKDKGPQVAEAELKAAKKINEAKDAAAKFQTASEFLAKYPKSPLRPQIVTYVAAQIAGVKDNAQKISLAENFMNTFAEAGDANLMYPVLVDAYLDAKRTEDAFNAAEGWLESNPEEIRARYLLAISGADAARTNNPKFVKPSQQYGLKAIELIEAGKKPSDFSDADWSKNKGIWLPQLYQAMGLLSLVNNNPNEALPRLQKASTLNPNDPFTYVLIGSIKNDEYTETGKQYKATTDAAAKTAMEKKLLAQMDEVIELYAHALGLMEGKPAYQPLREQLMPELENYYKYRHKGSTDGMQQLINKYKTPSTP